MNIIITSYHDTKKEYKGNHSGKEVLKRLPNKLNDYEIRKVSLPILFDDNFTELAKHIDTSTKAIISLGSLPMDYFALERVAINIKNANGKDNNGYSPTDETIMLDGRNAYFSSLPIREIESRLNKKEIPTVVSNSAGLSICNNIMYHTAYYCENSDLDYLFGFIHIPNMIHEENNTDPKAMEFDKILSGIKVVLGEVMKALN